VSDRIHAAGGVVMRDGQVAVVHRPRYDDWTLPKGKPKVVRYWLMDIEHEGSFVPNDETDQLRWVTLDEALRLLTYDRDRDVLRSL
jgi:8-oxo-dGTP diphosphatase